MKSIGPFDSVKISSGTLTPLGYSNVFNDIHLQLLCEHGLSTRSWYRQRSLVDKGFDVKLIGSRFWRTRTHPLEIARGLKDSYITLDRIIVDKLGFYLTWTRSPRMSCAWWWGRGTGWAGTRWWPPFGPPWPPFGPWWPPPWTPPAPSPALWWLPTLGLGETLPLCLLTLFPSVRSIVARPLSNETPENVWFLLRAISDIRWWWGFLSISPADHLNGNPWGLFTSLSEILSDWSSAGIGSRFSSKERDVKIDGGAHRLERRSIEEESLQIWWWWQ